MVRSLLTLGVPILAESLKAFHCSSFCEKSGKFVTEACPLYAESTTVGDCHVSSTISVPCGSCLEIEDARDAERTGVVGELKVRLSMFAGTGMRDSDRGGSTGVYTCDDERGGTTGDPATCLSCSPEKFAGVGVDSEDSWPATSCAALIPAISH